jgi:hypothetical protein
MYQQRQLPMQWETQRVNDPQTRPTGTPCSTPGVGSHKSRPYSVQGHFISKALFKGFFGDKKAADWVQAVAAVSFEEADPERWPATEVQALVSRVLVCACC